MRATQYEVKIVLNHQFKYQYSIEQQHLQEGTNTKINIVGNFSADFMRDFEHILHRMQHVLKINTTTNIQIS